MHPLTYTYWWKEINIMAKIKISDMTAALLDKYKRAGAKVTKVHRGGSHPHVTITIKTEKYGELVWAGAVPSSVSDKGRGHLNIKALWEGHFKALGVTDIKDVIDNGKKKVWK